MAYAFLLGIALVIFFRSTTSVERRKYLFAVLKRVDLFYFHGQRYWNELEPFRARLRERTRFAPVTPDRSSQRRGPCGIFFQPICWTIRIHSSRGARALDPVRPREWWRLITTLFVHRNIVDLFINLLALVPLGLLLERSSDRSHSAAGYLTAGMFSSLFILSWSRST